ncbi:MAG: DinB family protein [Gemmatimonadales bacterium]
MIRVTEITGILQATPTALEAIIGGLSEEIYLSNEGPDTWSPREVVAHLVEAERALWIPRAKSILENGEAATFVEFDRVAHRLWMSRHSRRELLEMFRRERTRSLVALEAWGDLSDRLDERGLHPDFGPVTLGQLLSTWAVHDLSHLRQIVRVTARQFAEEVGPWRKYLSIVTTG